MIDRIEIKAGDVGWQEAARLLKAVRPPKSLDGARLKETFLSCNRGDRCVSMSLILTYSISRPHRAPACSISAVYRGDRLARPFATSDTANVCRQLSATDAPPAPPTTRHPPAAPRP
jgi:hypothetical protein